MLRSRALELGAKKIREDPQAQTLSLLCLHPCEAREKMGFSAAKTSKSLKKSRAARAMEPTNDTQNRDSVPDDEKSEDPAKMTHSIIDFLSRHRAQR